MNATHGGGHGQGLPRSLLSGTLPSQGASAVARVSDRGRVAEVYDDPVIVLTEKKKFIFLINT
jgi:hypothetical protein